jgi:hypothetical protein
VHRHVFGSALGTKIITAETASRDASQGGREMQENGTDVQGVLRGRQPTAISALPPKANIGPHDGHVEDTLRSTRCTPDIRYQRADSPFLEKLSPIRVWKFPVLLRRQFGTIITLTQHESAHTISGRDGPKVTVAMERAGIDYLDQWAIVPDRWPSAATFVRELYLAMQDASPPRSEVAKSGERGCEASRSVP